MSTVGVGGRWQGPLPERWLDEPREFHNTYEASKAEAEALLRREISAGFPATVHRPSMVVGDSRSGAVIHFQIFYFICEFLGGMRTMGIYPQLGNATLDIVANDYVASAIVAASQDMSTTGEIFHLCSGPGNSLRLAELRKRIRAAFRESGVMGWLPCIDLSRERFLLVTNVLARLLPERERRAVETLPIYLDYLSGVQQFGNDLSTSRLSSMGIDRPANERVVDRVIAYYLQQKAHRRS